MQTKNVSEILERLKIAYNIKNDSRLADFLGVTRSTISTWKSRNSIDYDLVFAKCKNLNINWLLTGQGSMFLEPSPAGAVNDHTQEYQAKEQEIARLKKEIANLKEELKKIDKEDAADTLRLQALKNRIKELETENISLSNQIKLLKEIIIELKKA
ncbi:CI repressor [Caldithrix abyssi DSM 13497]|uniref:CI repressor n=2 Tax=Caldithrix abyssi DSM 13497 TaxID=880073 RepID=H1XPY1_CALAY|nr:helix-turn-helix transcriptional regulator [Caldithrix abyssi]EHO41107.1 CI repressor [Caldithrix abyssi DSM 13497]